MPTLPDTTTAFATGATEAQFKTFLLSQRSFLAGLLGTDGTAATARATLGVSNGVTSVNGNTGAVTAGQIAAAATAGYGYTPANSAHTHSDYVSANMTHDAVGSLCFCKNTQNSAKTPGSTQAGSWLKPTEGSATVSGTALSGTWRCLGHISSANQGTLWQRIS